MGSLASYGGTEQGGSVQCVCSGGWGVAGPGISPGGLNLGPERRVQGAHSRGPLTHVLMVLAWPAEVRVFQDSSEALLAGLMWAIITVRLFPPRESWTGRGEGGAVVSRDRLPGPAPP